MRPPNRLLNLLRNNARRGEFRAEANTIYLYDVIAGDDIEAGLFGGVTATGVIAALDGTNGPLRVRINSPGGDVFAGWAIAQALRDYAARKGEVTAIVDGVAASAASVIAVSASRVLMARSSLMMIHKAWSAVVGNSDDMLQVAALLEKVDGLLAGLYAGRGGGDEDEFMALMSAETWFTPDEAMALRLADGLADDEAQGVAARWDLTAFANAPAIAEAEPVPVVEPPAVSSDDEITRRVRQHRARMLMKSA